MTPDTCLCNSYPFPHRHGGGKCPAPNLICSGCLGECKGSYVDFGIGSFECHGYVGVDRDVHYSSDCCEEPVLTFTGVETEDPVYGDN